MTKFLGIDWGEKRIGLALGDSETKIATPFKVVANMEDVLQVVKEEEIDEIVIGEPLKMRNARIEMSKDFLNFLTELEMAVKFPINKIDERLSSKAADSLAGDKAAKAPRDAVAAMLILQTYLDRIS